MPGPGGTPAEALLRRGVKQAYAALAHLMRSFVVKELAEETKWCELYCETSLREPFVSFFFKFESIFGTRWNCAREPAAWTRRTAASCCGFGRLLGSRVWIPDQV